MEHVMDARIRRLERTNRLLLICLAAIALGLLAGGRPAPEDVAPIRAQRFELVDADGTVQAVMGRDAGGSVGFFVMDPQGVTRLSVTHDAEQSALFINDAEGTIRIGVAQFAHGGGGVALHGAQSKGATVLYHKGAGSLSFFDEQGNVTQRVAAP